MSNQKEWEHNFGLVEGKQGAIIGKMFGVLVVKTQKNEIGYLAAFSGKLAGGFHHSKFVPPVFDSLTENSFLNKGMEELTRINKEIKKTESIERIAELQELRRKNSVALQDKLFNQYYFLNQIGEEKSLREIFKTFLNIPPPLNKTQHTALTESKSSLLRTQKGTNKSDNSQYTNPPSGAGECAAPKLLQYAFQNKMKPLAIAEFWWGLSPKSESWKHGHFYPACKEKCEPILAHMLEGVEMDEVLE